MAIRSVAGTPCQQTVPEPVVRRLVLRLNLLFPNLLWDCGAGQRWPTPGVFRNPSRPEARYSPQSLGPKSLVGLWRLSALADPRGACVEIPGFFEKGGCGRGCLETGGC